MNRKMMLARTSWAVAPMSHERPRIKVPAEAIIV